MGQMTDEHKILRRPRFRWPYHMKVYLKEIRIDSEDWIHLASDGS